MLLLFYFTEKEKVIRNIKTFTFWIYFLICTLTFSKNIQWYVLGFRQSNKHKICHLDAFRKYVIFTELFLGIFLDQKTNLEERNTFNNEKSHKYTFSFIKLIIIIIMSKHCNFLKTFYFSCIGLRSCCLKYNTSNLKNYSNSFWHNCIEM